MSNIVISVDMEISPKQIDQVVLKKVTDSQGNDITKYFQRFCEGNGFDISKKEDIENAAVPFITANPASI